jgi:hypothetical protein
MTPGTRIESLAEINIRPAGSWHRRSELGVNHPVADGKQCAEKPAEYCLGTAHRGKNHADGNKWADANHLQHIHGGGLHQTHAANKFFRSFREFGGEEGCRVFGQIRCPDKRCIEYRAGTIAA